MRPLAEQFIRISERVLSLLLLMTLSLPSSSPAAFARDVKRTESTTDTQAPTSRLLHFPTEQAVGALFLIPAAESGFVGQHHQYKVAKGDVTAIVPKGTDLILDVNQLATRYPKAMNSLPPASLDGLKIFGMEMNENPKQNFADAVLALTKRLTGLKTIFLDRSDVSDAGLSVAKSLVNLEVLSASITAVRGSFLKDLEPLRKIKMFILDDSKINDDNLRYIRGWKKLSELRMANCTITDNGCKYISACTGIKRLALKDNPKITDEGLTYLATLPQLEYLEIQGTGVTAKGIAKLQAAKHLNALCIPFDSCSKSEQQALKRLMPKVDMYAAKAHKPTVSDAERRMFAPLAR